MSLKFGLVVFMEKKKAPIYLWKYGCCKGQGWIAEELVARLVQQIAFALSLSHSGLQSHWLIRENGINMDCLYALMQEKKEITEGLSRNTTGISKHDG